MTPAEMAARSRAQQGLPERVEDPSTLAAIATLMQTTPPGAGEAVEVASARSGRGANHDTV